MLIKYIIFFFFNYLNYLVILMNKKVDAFDNTIYITCVMKFLLHLLSEFKNIQKAFVKN